MLLRLRVSIKKGLSTERQISAEHITNNRGVRKILLKRGIKPEELPSEEDIKKLERRSLLICDNRCIIFQIYYVFR